MNTLKSSPSRPESRCGFVAGLFLLLFLVGMAIFVVVAWHGGAFNPFAQFQGTGLDRYSDPNAQPWDEAHLFINEMLDGYDMGGRRPPFHCQPKLKDTIRYSSWVFDAKNNRYGKIQFDVLGLGDAQAEWSGEFDIANVHYELSEPRRRGMDKANVFKGNIAPLKIYKDENGLDHSKLYVITGGTFEMKAAGQQELATGAAYITAWIDKDYIAQGNVSIPWFIDEKPLILEWGPVEPTAP